MQLLVKNEADYLVRHHTELRGGPLMNRLRLAVASYRASGFVHWPITAGQQPPRVSLLTAIYHERYSPIP
jgi:hypothetical protein